jgi:hypothetical protein
VPIHPRELMGPRFAACCAPPMGAADLVRFGGDLG